MHATYKETFAVTVTPKTCVRCINSVIAHSDNEDDNMANDHRIFLSSQQSVIYAWYILHIKN